ncbi:MAG: hypothetical protein M3T96_02320 [Acidobacteriota bacterium]|nr:hypothetical protein [Acidobacteriota bacterium]
MGLLDIFKSKKTIGTETERRDFLQNKGRITDGTIIESEIKPNGEELVYYCYSVQGTDFESSEILTDEQRADPLKYAAGAKVGVRFDPKNHGNSMLV